MASFLSPRHAAILAGLCIAAHPARAQYTGGILPVVGNNTRINDLRPQLERYFNPPAPLTGQPAFTIVPSIGVDVGVTDNAQRSAAPRRADEFTIISPQVIASADTARLKVNLVYAPQVSIYASQSSQTRFDQFGNGSAKVTVVPDLAFIDFRGAITEQSLTGNALNQFGTSSFNRQNEVQTISFSVTPYLEQRFGGWGTARLGYSLARTLQDNQGNQTLASLVNTTSNGLNGTPGFGALGNLTTQRERASFASGENLGRFNDLLVVEAFQYSGGGSYTGAYRRQIQNEVGFALTHQVTLLGGFGYQDIRYNGTPVYRIQEPTYNGGVRYTPNPDSTVTVLYGHRDGISSISFEGNTAPTGRTRLIGSYSTGVTTDIEEAQNVLSTTTVGPTGLVTDTTTGAPVGSGGLFGVQNGIYKLRRLSATGLLLQDRDSYSVGITNEDRTTLTSTPTVLGNGILPAGTSSNSTFFTGSWQHDLAPDLNSLASVQYGISNSTQQLVGNTGSSQRTLSLTAALNKQFSATLSGSIRYTYTNQTGSNAVSGFNSGAINSFNASLFNTGSYTENAVLVGLRKSF